MSKYKERKRALKGPAFQPARTASTQEAARKARLARRRGKGGNHE